ncbi:MAG: porin [Hyphomicrobium sp.]
MVGEFGKSAGWISIVAAAGFVLGGSVTATAADLGGDCCADLEERIAELEATTARKGNRKVSLTVYGKVNEAAMFWDDGKEDNVYMVTNDASRSRFGFKGKAKITSDWSAYYKIEIGIRTANSKRSNQFDPNGNSTGFGALDLRHSEWGLKSKTWGKFGVGLQKNITKDITKSNLAGTGDVGKYSDAEDYGGGFFLVAKNSSGASPDGLQWRRLIARTGAAPGEGDRRDSIVYYTPEWHGFSIGAAWGGDDTGAIGALYKGEFGSVKVKAGIAYMQNTSEDDAADFHGCPGKKAVSHPDADCDGVGGSISILDTHHGLYANFAAGQMWDDTIRSEPNFTNTNVDNTYWFWAMEAGIQQKWNHLGKTTLFGQYYKYEGGGINQTVDGDDPINTFNQDADIFSSEVEFWGLGIMQKIDAAEMKLYSLYRHYDFDLKLADEGAVQASAPLEDFQVLMTGAVIYF